MSREGKGTDAATEAGRSQPLPWSEAERRMAGGGWFWLATVRPDGAPHLMPLFAAWANTSFFIASKDRARKSRNLEVEPRCVISTDTGDLHIIVEGTARHVRDEATLRRAVDAFRPSTAGQPGSRGTGWTQTTAHLPPAVLRMRCMR